MMNRFIAPIGTELATWTRKPSAEQIDATGRALPTGHKVGDGQQEEWFGAIVFDTPPTYRGGQWRVDEETFSSQQVARAVAEGRRLGGR